MRQHSKINQVFLFLITLFVGVQCALAQNKEPNAFPEDAENNPALLKNNNANSAKTAGGFEITVRGYLQTRYQAIQNAGNVQYVGRNDGFQLSNARIMVDARKNDLGVYFALEGARDIRLQPNRNDADLRNLMVDAYARYNPSSLFELRAGRFKPPYDAAEFESNQDMLLIDRPLASRGVFGVEGLNVSGMSLPRQMGLQANGRVKIIPKKLKFTWYASLVNGTDAEIRLNDNDSLAYVGRIKVEGKFSDEFRYTLGGGAYYNRASQGALPDLVSEKQFGWTVDARLRLSLLDVSGQYMVRENTYVDVNVEPSRKAVGWHVTAGLVLSKLKVNALKGFVPAYRYATYDPTYTFNQSSDTALAKALKQDELIHHTFGLNYLIYQQNPNYPIKLQVNYTIAKENQAREIRNDRFDVLMQMTF
jgi:hypothetical protein